MLNNFYNIFQYDAIIYAIIYFRYYYKYYITYILFIFATFLNTNKMQERVQKNAIISQGMYIKHLVDIKNLSF